MTQKNTSWGGRFTEGISSLTEEYTESVSYDKALYKVDIAGSKAHANMLCMSGILTAEESKILIDGLTAVEKEIENGDFAWKMALEDVHMNIEARLTELVGDVGKKLHTARSRNDQVCLDFRLFVSERLNQWIILTKQLIQALLIQAKNHKTTLLPGCTHFQPAQPVSLAHHLLAYSFMFKRDVERMADANKRVSVSPLGAAALAGTTFPIQPELVAKELGMAQVFSNSMEAVGDRDFALEALFCGATTAMHLSRLCEELIIWSNPQFGFVQLSDKHTTGSSIMPQKKNPDIAELMRGKTGRIYGNLFNLFTQLKGLPLAYNRDLQEDKEPFFDTDRTISLSLSIMAEMLEAAVFSKENMALALKKGFLNATELADYLVTKGIPFREAHHITGSAVAFAEKQNKGLEDLTLDELQNCLPSSLQLDASVFHVLQYNTAVERRNAHGGTGINSVTLQIQEIEAWLI